MQLHSAANLRHDPLAGEVDPRSYPLLTMVALKCARVGDNERLIQANKLIYWVDKMATAAGDGRCRIHLTAKPGVEPKVAIEVRLQPIMTDAPNWNALVEKVRLNLSELAKHGETDGWKVLAAG